MIAFEIGGVRYENVLEASFQESMVEFTNEASFSIALDGTEKAPFFVDDECVVYLDDTKVMTGYIYDVDLSYGKETHSLSYIVRDKTADFSDSDIDSVSDLSGSLSLVQIIEKIAQGIGTSISVSNEFPELKNFDLDVDGISPEFADSAFDYVEGLARKRQVLLSTNPDGEIAIYRNSGELLDGKIQNSIDDEENNNILSCSFSLKTSSTYNKYVVRSQPDSKTGKSPFGSGISNKEMTNQVGFTVDSNVRSGRQRCLIAEESSTGTTNEQRAIWQKDFSDVDSQSYSVVLQGHSIGGKIFQSNRLIQVSDDFARINEELLIKSVSAVYSTSEGSTTTLDLVNKNAFRVLSQAEEEETLPESRKNIFKGG